MYPGVAVFFEVTAKRLRMEDTRLQNDPAAVERDLEQIIITNARQLSNRIDDFRAGHYTFDGATSSDLPLIKPVIVTNEQVPMWSATARWMRAAMQRTGDLQQPGVEPLAVIGVDELEMLESLSHGGVEILGALRAHSTDAELRNVSLRNYLQRTHRVPDNAALRAEYISIGNRGARLLFGTNLGPPTHEEIASRAYKLYEQHGRRDGHDLEDWLTAEREAWGGSPPTAE